MATTFDFSELDTARIGDKVLLTNGDDKKIAMVKVTKRTPKRIIAGGHSYDVEGRCVENGFRDYRLVDPTKVRVDLYNALSAEAARRQQASADAVADRKREQAARVRNVTLRIRRAKNLPAAIKVLDSEVWNLGNL